MYQLNEIYSIAIFFPPFPINNHSILITQRLVEQNYNSFAPAAGAGFLVVWNVQHASTAGFVTVANVFKSVRCDFSELCSVSPKHLGEAVE